MATPQAASALADVLQVIGFSDLIENFKGEFFEDVSTFLTNADRMKKLVPEEILNDFMLKIDEFFHDNIGKEENSTNNISEDENSDRENVAYNNSQKVRQSINEIFAIENVDILKILKNSFEGSEILKWHNSKSFLKPGQRTRLVHVIIAAILNTSPRALQNNDFKILSEKIVQVFPKECTLIYYEPPISKKKSDTGKKKNCKGKLFNKYNNLKKYQIQFDNSVQRTEPVEDSHSNVQLTEEIETSLEWLKNQEEPWEETKRHWKITASYRYGQVEEKRQEKYPNKIASVYEDYCILKTPKAYELVVDDFSSLQFCSNPEAIKNFKEFFIKAVHVKPLKKDDFCDMLKSMLENDELGEDDGILVRLMLLCIMLPSHARIPVGKKIWKPSSVESLEGIVARVKVDGDIEQAKIDRRQDAKLKKMTVQPYIIIVENEDYHVHSVYLCIDDILYAIPSLLEALDACFKSFHVFGAYYPRQSEQIWLMLQLGLYQFRTKWDSSITSVIEILNDMCLLPKDK